MSRPQHHRVNWTRSSREGQRDCRPQVGITGAVPVGFVAGVLPGSCPSSRPMSRVLQSSLGNQVPKVQVHFTARTRVPGGCETAITRVDSRSDHRIILILPTTSVIRSHVQRDHSRPILQPTYSFDWIIGSDEAGAAHRLAQETSWALLDRVRKGADAAVVDRVVDLASGVASTILQSFGRIREHIRWLVCSGACIFCGGSLRRTRREQRISFDAAPSRQSPSTLQSLEPQNPSRQPRSRSSARRFCEGCSPEISRWRWIVRQVIAGSSRSGQPISPTTATLMMTHTRLTSRRARCGTRRSPTSCMREPGAGVTAHSIRRRSRPAARIELPNRLR